MALEKCECEAQMRTLQDAEKCECEAQMRTLQDDADTE
jgi:hypothetical protein